MGYTKYPFLVLENLISDENADTVDGLHAATTATANTLLALDANKDFNLGTGDITGTNIDFTGTAKVGTTLGVGVNAHAYKAIYAIFDAAPPTNVGLYAMRMAATRSSASNVLAGLFIFYSQAYANAGAGNNIENVSHFHASNMSVTSGTVTNQYAFYAAALSGAANNYGVYISGDNPSYFGGKVGIGMNEPLYQLDVLGSVRFYKTTDIQNITQTTGTAHAACFNIKSGNGTTSSNYAYIQVTADKTSPQSWIIGMRGNENYIIRDVEDSANRLTIDSNGNVTWNDIGADCNYNIESDINANAFFLRGSDGNIGIGTNSPSTLLHIQQSASNFIRIEATGINQNAGFQLKNDAKQYQVSVLGSTSDSLVFRDVSAGIDRITIQTDGSVIIGSPTGGGKGVGTINAKAVYDDNVLLTDYVFDKYFDDEIKREDIEKGVDSDYTIPTREEFIEHIKENRHLPRLTGRLNWTEETRPSLGKFQSQLCEQVEHLAIYIKELHEEIQELYLKSAIAIQPTVNQTILDITYIKIVLDNEIYDEQGEYDSLKNYRFTATKAGKYMVIGTITFNSGIAGKEFDMIINKNGVNTVTKKCKWINSAIQSEQVTAIIDLDVNDYLELWTYQNSGVSRDIVCGTYTGLQIKKV